MILLGAGLALAGLVGMQAKPHVLFPWMQRWLQALQSVWGDLPRRLPDTFHPNVIAAALALCIPFGVSKTLASLRDRHRRQWMQALAASMLTLAMVVVFALAQSRAAFMALTMAAVVVVALTRPRWLMVAVPILMGAVVAGGMSIGWTRLADALVSSEPTYGLAWRRGIWSAGIQMAGDFPFTGVGFGCFEPVLSLLYPPPPGWLPPHAHNLLLQVAIDLGLPGLVAFLAILGLVAYLGISSYVGAKQARQARWLFLSAACLASLAGLCVHGLFDAASWGNKGAFVPWVVMGICVAVYRRSGEVASTR